MYSSRRPIFFLNLSPFFAVLGRIVWTTQTGTWHRKRLWSQFHIYLIRISFFLFSIQLCSWCLKNPIARDVLKNEHEKNRNKHPQKVADYFEPHDPFSTFFSRSVFAARMSQAKKRAGRPLLRNFASYEKELPQAWDRWRWRQLKDIQNTSTLYWCSHRQYNALHL